MKVAKPCSDQVQADVGASNLIFCVPREGGGVKGEVLDVSDRDLIAPEVMIDVLTAERPGVIRFVGFDEDFGVFQQGGIGELARDRRLGLTTEARL
jgi:hypothetical protein